MPRPNRPLPVFLNLDSSPLVAISLMTAAYNVAQGVLPPVAQYFFAGIASTIALAVIGYFGKPSVWPTWQIHTERLRHNQSPLLRTTFHKQNG